MSWQTAREVLNGPARADAETTTLDQRGEYGFVRA
jgi:hypothetical protein